MRDVALRFLKFEALNDHLMIHAGLLVVWLILLVAAVMSLRQQEMSLGAKWFWLALIFLLPFLGLAAYALRCLAHGDWSFLKFFLGPGKSAKSVRN